MVLIVSIVAISAVELLKWSFAISTMCDDPARIERALYWGVEVHPRFVASGGLMALRDWLAAKSEKDQPGLALGWCGEMSLALAGQHR